MYMDKPSKSPSSSTNQTVSEVKETPLYIPPTPIPSSPEQKRELLKESYKVALSLANPHLNYIETSISKQKGGYAFSPHTNILDVTPLASAEMRKQWKNGLLRIAMRCTTPRSLESECETSRVMADQFGLILNSNLE